MTKLKFSADLMPVKATEAAPLFTNVSPQFVDFGCGVGNSMRFAEGVMGATGVGLEASPDRAAAAIEKGYDVAVGDLLHFAERSVASASFAVDVFPELETRRAFETALVVMLRAARDFALIQHMCFDSAEALLARGETMAAYTSKAVLLRPRAIDYLHFVQQNRNSLNIVGMAAFGIGEVPASASPMQGASGALVAKGTSAYRSLRVIIARKHINRFRASLQKAGAGQLLMYWEAEA